MPLCQLLVRGANTLKADQNEEFALHPTVKPVQMIATATIPEWVSDLSGRRRGPTEKKKILQNRAPRSARPWWQRTGVLDDPVMGIIWLAKRLATYGEHVRAGDIVLSGSFLCPIEARHGDVFDADFGSFGRVVISF